MSSIGYPQTGISETQFYSQALEESDANKRRRLFADARASNLCSYRVYVLAAQAEEKWGADITRLKALLTKGVIVFRNPAGQHSHCSIVTRGQWLSEADSAFRNNFPSTSTALRSILQETGV
ncbi:hypothetical protein BX616_010015 [Lobosporangium transversale]|nr:hypothetical protein BX616_010015 [Lobosporangium transversale]